MKSRCRCRCARCTPDDVALIRARYDEEYTRFYDRPVPGSDVEVMSYAVLVATEVEPVEAVAAESSLFEPDSSAAGSQLVRDTTTGEVSTWAVYERASLQPGACITGPAILAEDETSTLVGPGWRAVVNGLGYIEMTR